MNKRLNNQKSTKQKSKLILLFAAFIDSLSKLISSSYFLGHFANHNVLVQKFKSSAANRFFARYFSFKPSFLNFKLKCAALSENSMTLNSLEKLMFNIFHSSLRSCGVFLLSFGAAIISLNLSSGIENLYKLAYSDTFVLGCILSLVSLVLLPVKNKNLAQAIQSSKIISGFFTYFFSLKHINNNKDSCVVKGTTGFSMFFGLLCGIISYSISPRLILFIFFMGFILYLTLTKPENGILALFLLFPLLPQKLTAFIIIMTAISTAFKILRGKRSLHINIASIIFIIFSFIVASSTIYSLGKAPENDAVTLFIILLASFIMQTLVKSSEFANKCISMLLLSSAIAVIYNLYSFSISFISSGNYSDILNIILSAKSSGTFTSNDSYAAYLICVIPFIFVKNNILRSKMLALVLAFAAVFTIILTNSPFAIFALTASLIFTLIVFNKRSAPLIILVIAFVFSILYLFPSMFSIPSELFSNNTSYALKDSVISICKKFWMSGVGLGESALITAEIITGSGANSLINHINSYINLFIKLGFPLTFICISLALILISRPYSYAVQKHASPNAKNKCMIICTSTLALIIYAFKFNVFSDFKTTLMLFLLMSLGYSVCDSADNDYVSDFSSLHKY